MFPLIVLRPQPGCDASLAAARALGLEAHGFPLFAVRPVPWEAPPPEDVDALLLGSANALRHAGRDLIHYVGKPAYCVGKTTADAARGAGLNVALCGTGGLQRVLDRVDPAHHHLLRLAGRERIALTPPAGAGIVERVVYASEALPLPAELAGMLRAPCVVALHSAEAARHFADQCTAFGIDRGMIRLPTIGPRVTQAAGKGWATVATAPTPSDEALLALAAQLCNEPFRPQDD